MYLRTKCIERGTTNDWSLNLRGGVLFAKVHGHATTEIILGFTPQLIHFDVTAAPTPDHFEVKNEDALLHQQEIFMASRDEKKCLASEEAAYTEKG